MAVCILPGFFGLICRSLDLRIGFAHDFDISTVFFWLRSPPPPPPHHHHHHHQDDDDDDNDDDDADDVEFPSMRRFRDIAYDCFPCLLALGQSFRCEACKLEEALEPDLAWFWGVMY